MPDPGPPQPAIVFHAGFHKTGTTSLQAALRLHRAPLAALFAVETRAASPAFLAAAEAARALSINPQASADLRRTLAAWAEGLALQPGQGLLASSEDFAGHLPGRFGLPDYRAALPIAQAICAALRHRFPDRPLTLLYTTREPAGWLRSIHWQLSKHDDMTMGPNRFARSHAAAADFAPLLARLRATLPDIRILHADLADLASRRLGPVEAMYDAARLPGTMIAGLAVPPRANRAPPHDLARLFVKLNRSDLPRDRLRQLKRDMLAAGQVLLGDDDGLPVPPPGPPR